MGIGTVKQIQESRQTLYWSLKWISKDWINKKDRFKRSFLV